MHDILDPWNDEIENIQGEAEGDRIVSVEKSLVDESIAHPELEPESEGASDVVNV